MARKLPWITGDGASSNASIKRGSPERTASQPRRRAQPQTPSSSRQSRLQLPPSVEPMQEGFDKDDIWMMVEDEFDALARKFTVHLHQAEYDRRVKLAREAPPKPLPEPRSPMTKSTKRRLEQDLLHARQSKSLDDIGATRKEGMPEDHVGDPWRGTSLAGLIVSGSQDKVSLKGLDRLPSTTRAAQGFGRLGSDDLQDTRDVASESKSKQKERERSDANGIEEDSSNDRVDTRARNGGTSPRTTFSSKRQREKNERDYVNGAAASSTATAASGKALSVSMEGQSKMSAASSGSRSTSKPFLPKRRKIKQESSMDDRIAEMPMF